jgi:hypothetical protein
MPNLADRDLLDRLAPMIGKAMAVALKPALERIEGRLAALEAETVSLRRAQSAAPAERRFVEIVPAEEPGWARLLMDDGSHVKVRDTRDQTWGRA